MTTYKVTPDTARSALYHLRGVEKDATPRRAAALVHQQITALGNYTSWHLESTAALLSRMSRLSPERLALWIATLEGIASNVPATGAGGE